MNSTFGKLGSHEHGDEPQTSETVWSRVHADPEFARALLLGATLEMTNALRQTAAEPKGAPSKDSETHQDVPSVENGISVAYFGRRSRVVTGLVTAGSLAIAACTPATSQTDPVAGARTLASSRLDASSTSDTRMGYDTLADTGALRDPNFTPNLQSSKVEDYLEAVDRVVFDGDAEAALRFDSRIQSIIRQEFHLLKKDVEALDWNRNRNDYDGQRKKSFMQRMVLGALDTMVAMQKAPQYLALLEAEIDAIDQLNAVRRAGANAPVMACKLEMVDVESNTSLRRAYNLIRLLRKRLLFAKSSGLFDDEPPAVFTDPETLSESNARNWAAQNLAQRHKSSIYVGRKTGEDNELWRVEDSMKCQGGESCLDLARSINGDAANFTPDSLVQAEENILFVLEALYKEMTDARAQFPDSAVDDAPEINLFEELQAAGADPLKLGMVATKAGLFYMQHNMAVCMHGEPEAPKLAYQRWISNEDELPTNQPYTRFFLAIRNTALILAERQQALDANEEYRMAVAKRGGNPYAGPRNNENQLFAELGQMEAEMGGETPAKPAQKTKAKTAVKATPTETASSANGVKRPVVAVYGIEAKKNSVDASTAAYFTSVMEQAVMESGAFSVVDRRNMEQLMAEAEFQMSDECKGGAGTEKYQCFVELGGASGAEYVLIADVTKFGTNWNMTIKITSMRDGEVKSMKIVECSGDTACFEPKLVKSRVLSTLKEVQGGR